MQVWKTKRAATATPCLKKHVFGYGYVNKAIVGLFIAGANPNAGCAVGGDMGSVGVGPGMDLVELSPHPTHGYIV